MKAKILCVVAAVWSLGASGAQAATLFQSIPNLTVNPILNAWCSDCSSNGYKVFDSFRISQSAIANSLTFGVQTSYFFPTDVTIQLWSEVANRPGLELASFTFSPSQFESVQSTPHDTSLVTVDLPNVSLVANQDYWISFYNPQNLGIPAYSGGGGEMLQFVSGAYSERNASAAFRIEGGAAVPEPATWSMLVVGFGAIGAAMRRRPKANLATA